MYTPRNNFPQEFGLYAENDSSKTFPVFARVRIQAPHVVTKKLIPQEFFLHVSVLCRGVFSKSFDKNGLDGRQHTEAMPACICPMGLVKTQVIKK